MEFEEVKIEIYLPGEFVAPMRDALNEIGACRLGKYDHCASVTRVTGCWRPLEGAQPFDGAVGKLSHSQECKMEIRCKKEYISEAVRIILQIHPYEEPVYNIIPLLNHLYR